MYPEDHDILEALKLELDFIDTAEGLGLGPAGLLQQGSLFRNSPVCADLRNSNPIDPCSRCPLLGFVPAHRRFESVPCHHIPLNAAGETIAMIDFLNQQYRLYRVVKRWLQSAIGWLEQDRASNRGLAALLLQGYHDPLDGLRPLLEGLGVQTLRAKTCREASKVLKSSSPPPLLFTEPILPDGTWSDVLDLLKEGGTAAALVVVSSEVDKTLAIEVIERGAFDCLVSPVAVLDLAHIVRCAVWSPCPRRRNAVRAASGGNLPPSLRSNQPQ
jgi:CheY-like chemotaxis protein